jgi:hypothetical protein
MGRNPPSQLKRAREQALKERRERKKEKKAARAASRLSSTADASPTQDSLAPIDKGDATAGQSTRGDNDGTIESSE